MEKREKKLLDAYIEMAILWADRLSAEVETSLRKQGRFEFISGSIGYCKYSLSIESEKWGEKQGVVSLICAIVRNNKEFAHKVEKEIHEISGEVLFSMLRQLKRVVQLAREENIYRDLCGKGFKPTFGRLELVEEGVKYSIEHETQDSQLSLSAWQTIGQDKVRIAEFQTTEPFDKALAGLYDKVASCYAFKNNMRFDVE